MHARFVGSHAETPLHWAAISDDVGAATALLDAGADIEAPGAVLGGGPPLADAVGLGQWQVARFLVDRGASTRLKDAAALGLMDRLDSAMNAEHPPDRERVTQALWSACHGGQQAAAEYLLGRGADQNWIGWDGLTPLDVASQEGHDQLGCFLEARGAKRAGELAVRPLRELGAAAAQVAVTRPHDHTAINAAATVSAVELHGGQQVPNPARYRTRRHHGPAGALRVSRSIARFRFPRSRTHRKHTPTSGCSLSRNRPA
jgi:hypothetical protein